MNRLWVLFLFILAHVSAFAQFSDDFSSNSLSDWTQSVDGRWGVVSAFPNGVLSENKQLHHAFDNSSSGKDAISHAVPVCDYANGTLIWKFVLRHGYDPSSTNGWSFILCSNVDAAQHVAGEESESIHVGVNLKGSNDILSVWRQHVAEGASSISVIGSSSINWQTDVGKNSYGYVVVVRNYAGDWRVGFSTSSFSDTVAVATFHNSEDLPWGNVGVYHWYTSTADQKLWVGDVSLGYEQTKFTDSDSEIAVFALPDTVISDVGGRVKLFEMEVADKGSGDENPTIVRKLKFQVPDASLFVDDFSLLVDGVEVGAGVRSEGQILTFTPDTPISVGDGATRRISLLGTVGSSGQDGGSYSLQLSSADDVDLAGGSSLIGAFSPAAARKIIFNVVATQLLCVEIPSQIVRGTSFNVEFNAVDGLDKLDIDYAEAGELLLSADDGSHAKHQAMFVNGKLLLNDITPIGEKYFDVVLKSGMLPGINRRIMLVNDTTSFLSNISANRVDVTCQNVDVNNAVTFAQFRVTDDGGDGLPTLVKQIHFSISPDNVVAEKLFGGIRVVSGESQLPARLALVAENEFSLELLNGGLSVPDGSSRELKFWMYVNPSSLTDNALQTISVRQIDADSLGSLFRSIFPVEVNTLNFNVEADTLYMSKLPSLVAPSELFNVDVKATDAEGNVDVDVSSECSLTFAGATIITFRKKFVKGVANFLPLQLPKSGLYKVTAECNSMSTTKNMLVADSDSYLLDAVSPMAIEEMSADDFFDVLKFRLVDEGTSDTLSTIIKEMQFVATDVNSNALGYRVVEDAKIMDGDQILETTSVTFSNGKFTLKFSDNSMFASNGATKEFLLRLKLRPSNYVEPFRLKCNVDGIKTADSSSQIEPLYSQQILSDTIAYAPVTPPTRLLQSGWYSTAGNAAVVLAGPENIDLISVSVDGTPINISDLPVGLDTLRFRMPGWNQPSSLLGLVCSRDGAEVSDTLTISLRGGLEWGDVVVSEIMADPVPAVDLPEIEYVELYNRTLVPIQLGDWTLEVGGKAWRLLPFTLPPMGYVAVSSPSGAALLSSYGNSVGSSYFGGLPNGGSEISVRNAGGTPIARTYYSDAQQQVAGVGGGRSLERVDAASDVEEPENWRLSADARGGTPGQANSVEEMLSDDQNIELLSIDILSDKSMLLTFNKSMSVGDSAQFFINGKASDATIQRSGQATNRLIVELTSDKLPSQLSVGKFEHLKDVFENMFTADFRFAYCQLPAKNDVAINEILFNPDGECSAYVELVNVSDKLFDMSSMAIAKRGESNNLLEKKLLKEHFAPLQPGEYALVCSAADAIVARYPLCQSSNFVVVDKMPQYGSQSGCAVLIDTAGSVVDEFSYSEKMHHSMLPTQKGVSLEREHPSKNMWHSASKEVGYGTPGSKNSQYLESASERGFSLPYENVSPDGDGYNDYLKINYKLGESGSVISVDIFTSAGKLVKHLCRNEMVGAEGSLEWDGVMDNGAHTSRGVYLAYIRVTYASGQTSVFKRLFSVAYR